MKRAFCWLALIAATLPAFVAAGQGPSASHKSAILDAPKEKQDLYPANANASDEIEAALKSAVTAKKRVLLIFGANWCYDCHVLDLALKEGAAKGIVNSGFLVVHVDIGAGEKNPDLVSRYRIPLDRGVPAVAVLSSDGRLLYSSGDGEFESARTMRKQDLVAFLRKWSVVAQVLAN